MNRAKKKILLLLAEGFEEIEAIAIFDILKRSGLDVIVAGLSTKEIKSARNMVIKTNITLNEISEDFDALVLPGGVGAERLHESKKVTSLIKKMHGDGKIIAAICAAPAVVLAPCGILEGKKITCYPSFKDKLPEVVSFIDKGVVVDSNIITSQGPGTVFSFGLKIAEILIGEKIVNTVKQKMLL